MVGPEGGYAKERNLQEVYVFYPGSYPIYPKDGYAGAPTSTIEAVKIGKKIHRLTGYRSLAPIHLFHRDKSGKDHYWQRSEGTTISSKTKCNIC